MSKTILYCDALPGIPWQDKPDGAELPLWRYTENPVIRRNPLPGVARIFNSAVVPFEGGYIGVFRGEQTNGIPFIYLGRSADGIHWDFDRDKIPFVNEQGEPFMPPYAYDPRLVKVEDTYYIIWCQDFYGASIGIAKTRDFQTFTRVENPFVPFNRNAVLFPRKINGMFTLLSRPSDSGHTPFGDIFLSQSPDMEFWGRHRHVMGKSGNWWENLKIGGGAAPIETWERLPNLVTLRSPQQRNVDLLPSFVNGKYAFYTRPMDDFIDTGSGGGVGFGLCEDITHPVIDEEIITSPRRYHTITEAKNGEGATPIKTEKGWLHIAHGVRNTAAGLRYVIYVFVTDLAEPWKVIAEPAGFLIAPRGWERVGDVSNVVFTNGAIARDNGEVYIYYAASDTRLHVASTTVDRMLDFAFHTPADPLRSRDCVAQRCALIDRNRAFLASLK